jgi:hypothetical protein
MPKSRNRRKTRTRSKSSRRPSWDDPELAPYLPYLRIQMAVDARERAGDAVGALDLMEQHRYGPDGRPYWAWWRVERLVQIASMPDLLPGWALSRWILAQALIHLDGPVRRITSKSLDLACRVGGQPGLATARDQDDRDALTRIMDHDWVFRQAFLHEYGGLRHFLTGGFAPVLARQADSIDEWVGAAMAAYRLLGSTPHTITWRDLGSGDEVASLNLGAAVTLAPGDCIIGRLVPSEQGRLFESVPLPVSEKVAKAVAAAPTDWPDALARHRNGSTLRWEGDDFNLLTDVPTHVWRGLAEDHSTLLMDKYGEDHEHTEVLLTTEELDRMTADLVMAALAGRLDDVTSPDPWPCVAAAAVAPEVWPSVLARLSPSDAIAVAALGQRLVGPAAELCWRTARLLRDSA